MFLDEVRLVSRIHHPNVVQPLDVVADGENILLVMEYVRGESLSTLLRLARNAGESIPQDIVSAIVCEMLEGLHAAHQALDEEGAPLNIIHRDVSPHNVVVGTDGLARVLDFGVAKAARRVQVTREGQLKREVRWRSWLRSRQPGMRDSSRRTLGRALSRNGLYAGVFQFSRATWAGVGGGDPFFRPWPTCGQR